MNSPELREASRMAQKHLMEGTDFFGRPVRSYEQRDWRRIGRDMFDVSLTVAFAVLTLWVLTGCAVQPDMMFPREQATRRAETTWLAMHAVDTLQTAQAMRHPECFYERNPLAAAVYGGKNPSPEQVIATNVVLGLAHSRVSRWLDDKVADSTARDDANSNAWYIGRIVWHGLSILGTGTAVIGNAGGGLTPWGARCPP